MADSLQGEFIFIMKKLIFGLIATAMFNTNIYAQNSIQHIDSLDITASNETLENEILIESENLRFSCTRVNVGINIFIAWASADIYIGCGFPPDYFYPFGCKPISKRLCEIIDTMNARESDYVLNLKDFFKDIDLSKVTSLEITKSTTWIDDNGLNTSIKLGRYDVEKNGDFKLEIIKVK